MNIMIKKFIIFICNFLAVFTVLFNFINLQVKALDNGIYLSIATPYYAHPYTGVIEDSGGEYSSVLGQSMTESALYNQALIEVDPNGYMYATIRFQLMDNIENPQFMVQDDGYSDFYEVSADCVKEDFNNNTSDFRILIPNENCIVRCTFYVVAMGRDVIFYVGFSDLYEGNGDFITSVEVTQPIQEQSQEQQPVENTEVTTITTTNEATSITTTATQSTTLEITSDIITTTTSANTTTTSVTTIETTQSSKSTANIEIGDSEVIGIVMFDEYGNEIKELFANKNVDIEDLTLPEDKSNTKSIIGLIAVIIVAIGVVITIYVRKKGNN